MTVEDTFFRSAEELEDVGVVFDEKIDKPADFEVHLVVGFIGHLRGVGKPVELVLGQDENPFYIRVGAGQGKVVCPASADAFQQEVLGVIDELREDHAT